MFVAESTRRLYADLVPEAASSLVPYGLDIAATDALLEASPRDRARADLGMPLDRRVLCVGSVEPRKGQIALARAFGQLGPSPTTPPCTSSARPAPPTPRPCATMSGMPGSSTST